MDRVTRARYLLFGLLACPWLLGLSMFLAGFTLRLKSHAGADRPYVSCSYGFITWLSVHHPFGNLSSPTYHVDPLALMALVATLLVLALCGWAFLHTIVRITDLGDRCHMCGYRIVGSAESCPECGVTYPDPAVIKRRTGLGRIHRRLVLAVLLIMTMPGILWAFTLVVRLRTFSTVHPFGGAHRSGTLDIERSLAMAAWVLIVLSTLAGAHMLWRYRRDKSDGAPTPLLNALVAASIFTLWRMMGFVIVIWLNVVLAVAVMLWLNDLYHYVPGLSFGVAAVFLCFSIGCVYILLKRRGGLGVES